MGVKNVKWISSTKLPCSCLDPAEVILVVTSSKVKPHSCDSGVTNPTHEITWTTVEAEIISSVQWRNPDSGQHGVRYVFEYDEDLLNDGEILTQEDISFVFCKGGMVEWIEQIVGQPVQIYTDSIGTKLVNQYGCEYLLPAGSAGSSSRYLITSEAHGLGEDGAIVLLSGDKTLAQADDLVTSADFVALIIDADNYYILGPGFQTILSHGLDLGVWYALSPTTAGGYTLSYDLGIDDIIQNAFIAVDENTILVDLQEASPARSIPSAATTTKASHGFEVGDLVSRVSGVWVEGTAGYMAYFVKEVIDVNTFVISLSWSGAKAGVSAGVIYSLDPSTPGALIDVDSIDASVDPITVVGFAPADNVLLGFVNYPQICCGSGVGVPDTTPPEVTSAIVPALGTTLVITFDETIIPASGITGWSVEVDSVANTIVSAVKTSSNKITLTLTDTVDAGAAVTYAYSLGNVTDSAGNALADITSTAATNNSAVGASGTLIFSESFEGGAHEATYDDVLGAPTAYINDAGNAPDGDYYISYLGASGTNDFQTYWRRDILASSYAEVIQTVAFGFKHIVPLNVNPLIRVREESGGSLVGLEVDIDISEGNNGLFCTYRNIAGGETLDAADIPGSQPTLAVDTWYRVTIHSKQNTGNNTNDGEIKWKLEQLEGSISGGTNGSVVATPIAERTISVNTHAANSPAGFNGHYCFGGNLTTGQARSDTWGLYYGNYTLTSVP